MEENRKIKYRMKAWIQKHMIAVWAFCSILFAIIIHLLFHWETDIEILHAKWEAGDILTYVSTVALGLLAVWQNKRFKEENDVAQNRLERLAAQANEISSINKVIEIESLRLIRLRTALDEFSEACSPETLSKVILFTRDSATDRISEMKINTVPADIRIDSSFTSVRRELTYAFGENGVPMDEFSKSVVVYKNAAVGFLQQIRADHLPPDDIYLEELFDAREQYLPLRDKLIEEREKLLNKMVYGSMTLDEIKAMYSQALCVEQEN